MTVWLVWIRYAGDDRSRELYGVYLTEERAKRACEYVASTDHEIVAVYPQPREVES